MSISDLTRRFFAYWWVIVATGLAFTLILFPWSNNTQYIGSITVGINFNDPALVQADHSSVAYVESFKDLSLYMEQRFTSVDIQAIISKESGLNKSSLSTKNPFYEIENQGAGFANLSYTSNSKEEAEGFTNGVKVAYTTVIKEWNESRQNEFKVTPMKDFTISIAQVQKPIQFQLLPVVSGVLLGIILIMVLPDPKKKTRSSNNSDNSGDDKFKDSIAKKLAKAKV